MTRTETGSLRVRQLMASAAGRVALAAVAIAVAAAAVMAGVSVAVPYLLQRAVADAEQRVEGRRVVYEQVRLRPWRPHVQVTGIEVHDASAGLLLQVPQLDLAIDWRTLTERRIVLERVEIHGLRLQLRAPVADGVNQLNGWLTRAAGPQSGAAAVRSRQIAVESASLWLTTSDAALAARQLATFDATIGMWDQRDTRIDAYTVQTVTPDGMSARLTGQWGGGPTQRNGRFSVSGLAVGSLLARLGLPHGGTGGSVRADAQGEYLFAAADGAIELRLQAPQVMVTDTVPEFARLTGLTASVRMPVRENSATARRWAVALDAVATDAGAVSLAWDMAADGGDDDHALAVSLQNVQASLLAAHIERHFGRAPSGGVLSVAVDARSAARQVTGTIRIEADRLRLASAERPMPQDGPDLAMALLEGPAGRVSLDVPFAFDRQSPEAHVEQLHRAISARLEAVVTSPLDALVQLAGPDGLPGHVTFEPGQAALAEQATADLERLARVLRERPRLWVRVAGPFDPQLDRDALAAQQVALHVTLATAGSAARGAEARPIDFAAARVWDVIEEFVGERLAASRRADIDARFAVERAATDPADRAVYYRALFDALTAAEPISDSMLERLARFRARTVADALIGLGVAPVRVLIDPVTPVAAAERAWPEVRLPLGLAAARDESDAHADETDPRFQR